MATPQNWVDRIRPIIQRLCRDYKCAFVDIAARQHDHEFSTNWSISGDGVHPNTVTGADYMSIFADLLFPPLLHKAVIPSDGSVTAGKTTFLIPSTNLFDKSTVTLDSLISANQGDISDNDTYCVSDFIPVKANTQYTQSYCVRVTFYNASQEYVQTVTTSTNTETMTSNATAAFARLSLKQTGPDRRDTVQFNEGAELLDYEVFTPLVGALRVPYDKLIDVPDTNLYATDPFSFNWKSGFLSKSGLYTASGVSLCTENWLYVKAGSTISVTTGEDDGVVVFTVLFTPNNISPRTITSYRLNSSDPYTVENDGWIKIAIRYDDSRALNNWDILNYCTLALIVDELPLERFEKPVNFGNAPISGIYTGQHADISGLNQSTSAADTIAAWDALIAGQTGYASKTDLGETYDGAHIYKYSFLPATYTNSNYMKKLPKVLITCGVHGHEKSSCFGLLYLMKDVIDNFDKHPVLWYLRSFVNFEILPVVNWSGWNNNLRANYNGVNINRNFQTLNWSDFDSDPDYTTPGTYNYRGTAPFSETESQIIRDFVRANSDAFLFIDIHTNGLDPANYNETPLIHSRLDSGEYEMRGIYAGAYLLSCLKPYFDVDYEIGGNTIYGGSTPWDSRMMIPGWVSESGNMMGLTVEVTPGSDSEFLGEKLTKYSADVLKLNGEVIGNIIAAILAEYSKGAN